MTQRPASRSRETILGFACTLARQCFINEYVFATTPEEETKIDELRRALTGASPSAMQIAALAMYVPLHTLLFRCGSARTEMESAHRGGAHPTGARARAGTSAARFNSTSDAIEDDVSKRVRQQYEENPYPRWVHAAGQVAPMPIDHYLRDQFPTAAFTPLGKTSALDMLIAGCGTGQVAIGSVQKHMGAQALAIDLSLSSLCYAKRKTPADLAARIDYAQADILKLGSIDRSFDVIDAMRRTASHDGSARRLAHSALAAASRAA